MKYALFFLSIGLLSSCSQHYSVSTNLDKENFNSYFSPPKVKIYHSEHEFGGKFKYLAAVEGESCQLDVSHEPANELEARTDARRNAFQLAANAIIFTGCTLLDTRKTDNQCITTRVCYGKAYQVTQQ